MPNIQRQHTTARMSKIVSYAGTVYLCGQTAKASASATAGITAQTTEVLARIDKLLGQAGSDRTRLLSVTIFLRDIGDFDAMNVVWESWLGEVHAAAPARTTVQAALATNNLLVEITVTAATQK